MLFVLLQDTTIANPLWLKLVDSGLTFGILTVLCIVLYKLYKQAQDKVTTYNESDRKQSYDIIAKNTEVINRNTEAFREVSEMLKDLLTKH